MQQNHELHTTHEMIRDRISELNIAVQELIDAIDIVADKVEQAASGTMRDLHTLEHQFGHLEEARTVVEPVAEVTPQAAAYADVVDIDSKRREALARQQAQELGQSTSFAQYLADAQQAS